MLATINPKFYGPSSLQSRALQLSKRCVALMFVTTCKMTMVLSAVLLGKHLKGTLHLSWTNQLRSTSCMTCGIFDRTGGQYDDDTVVNARPF